MPDQANIVSLSDKRAMSTLESMLSRTDKGAIISNVSNIILIIGHDPILSNLFGYDEFQALYVIHKPAPVPIDNAAEAQGPYPRAWSDSDITQVQFYIQRVWITNAKQTDVQAAMYAVASSRRYHPPRDWLATLQWDGEPRLDLWLTKAFGAKNDDYTSDVASCFMIAAVRRVRQPGVKFDHMMILEGDQGIGKSTALKTLFGVQWFTDNMPAKIESRDAALSLQGAWCIEFAEIEQIIRTEVEVIKAFLSRSIDRFRAPYGRTFLTYPRQCVTFGTTNDTDYLRDATGNRRFWPVWCNFVELEWIEQNRDQLWAEAAAREISGEKHWLTETNTLSQAKEAQADRLQEDVWEEKILHYIHVRQSIKTAELLSEALSIPMKDQTRREQMRATSVMKRAGWKLVIKKTLDGKSYREWNAP